MSRQVVNVLGFSSNENQFVVKSQNFSVKISNQITNSDLETPNPLEFLLSGIAGSINATGQIVAKELNMELKSIQVEISGEIESKKFEGEKTRSRAGLRGIEVVIKPTSNASLTHLKQWMDIVKERCPVYDNLINNTPVNISLVKDFLQKNVA
ncbi:OsmC family protein [Flavobacterium agricola]|uniref:OsmC family protein n=1 Tax=Flavobacterium agricola TaxID=2870839 RepID=A0ABY6M1E1_9FLAO|nr:OsmC family protein [Flavobacterium agricola]UYW00936.1 OsmC family protein [Flavobacterium agricola]